MQVGLIFKSTKPIKSVENRQNVPGSKKVFVERVDVVYVYV